MRWGGAAGLCLAVGFTLACAGLPFPRALPLTTELVGEERDAAVALGDDLVGDRFSEELTGAAPDAVATACTEHGRAFVWLAARDDRAPVRTAALRASAQCLAELDRGDLAVAARTGLRSAEPAEQAAAYALAGTLLPDEALESELLAEILAAMTAGRPEVRYEAMVAMDRRSWGDDPRAVEAYGSILRAPEPWLVTEALRLVRFRASGRVAPTPLQEAARPLLADIDPGIRGRAALALARLSSDDPELPNVLVGLLDDSHAYTRSAASEALADLAFLPATHDLVARLDDQATNTWDLLPFQRLDGTSVVQHHVGSLFERTDDAFLRALVRLTEPLGEARFQYREVHPGKWRDLDILAAGRDAAKWYADHEQELPTR